MKTRAFGTTGREVPIVGIGTWQMEEDDEGEAVAAIRKAIEVGATHVDTAEMYGEGRVEKIVGEAIAGRRDEVFLASKVLPRNATRKGTVAACERSLRALGTDRLDLYLLHWREDVPLEETFAAFEVLREQGKIGAWGVSNFDERDLADAVTVVGEGKIACNQVCYHLEERTIEHGLVDACRRHGIALVAYSPFGSGAFPTGEGGGVLEREGKRLGATARQVALAFLARHEHGFVIPKSSTVARVEENSAAGAVVLDAAAVAAIEAAFPLGRWRGLPTI